MPCFKTRNKKFVANISDIFLSNNILVVCQTAFLRYLEQDSLQTALTDSQVKSPSTLAKFSKVGRYHEEFWQQTKKQH